MLVDVHSITIDKEQNKVVIEGLNVDDLVLSDLETESEKFEVQFVFDLTQAGHRIYLYKVCKSKAKPDQKSMFEVLNSLTGQMLSLNFNFLTRTP